MQRWLYAFLMTPSALLTVGFGIWLIFERGFEGGWLQVKLALVVTAAALIVWHTRRPQAHAIEGIVFLVSLAIVWLGLALAHGPLPFD